MTKEVNEKPIQFVLIKKCSLNFNLINFFMFIAAQFTAKFIAFIPSPKAQR